MIELHSSTLEIAQLYCRLQTDPLFNPVPVECELEIASEISSYKWPGFTSLRVIRQHDELVPEKADIKIEFYQDVDVATMKYLDAVYSNGRERNRIAVLRDGSNFALFICDLHFTPISTFASSQDDLDMLVMAFEMCG